MMCLFFYTAYMQNDFFTINKKGNKGCEMQYKEYAMLFNALFNG